jgi:transposase-like protein
MREAGGKDAAATARRGDCYLPQFKERVVSFAKKHTFLETARKFNVHNATVSEWVRDHANKHNPTEEDEDENDEDEPQELMDTSSDAVVKRSNSAEDAFGDWLMGAVSDAFDLQAESFRETLVQKAEEAVQAGTVSDWFTMWLCRLKENIKRERSCSHLHYPPWFKTAVCAFSQRANPFQASKVFSMSHRTVCVWIKNAADPAAAAERKEDKRQKKKRRDGRAVTDVDIDKQLLKVGSSGTWRDD